MIQKLRMDAKKKFEETALHTFKYAQTVSTSFGHIDFTNIDFDSAEENESLLEFDSDEIKEKGIIVADLQMAMLKHPKLVTKYLFSKIRETPNKFTHMHMAYAADGVFIYVPKSVDVKTPVIFKARMKGNFSGNHVLIVAEENSKIDFVEISEGNGNGENPLRTSFVEIVAAEGAKVNYVSYQDLGKNVTNIVSRHSSAEKDADVNWFDAAVGSKLTKSDTFSIMEGSGASTKAYSAFFGTEGQHFDLSINPKHAAPYTTSNVLVKGALKKKSRAICTGTIKITENGKGSNGNEDLHILLLEEGAEADPIPVLEIDTDDVKCAHSSSVGRVDQKQLFYLKSRGIPEDDAMKLVVQGFFSKVLDTFPDEKLKEKILNTINELME